MKKIAFLFMLFFYATSQNMLAQIEKGEGHRIIFQLTTADTTAHKQLMKQFGNILSVSPSTRIEVVCHGGGIEMLMNEKSVVKEKIDQFASKGVEFMACEFTMKEKKIEKSSIMKSAGYVPAGIIEIVSKQELGWSYIKAGS